MGRWGQRIVIAGVQVLGLSVWFSISAVVPTLSSEWGLSTASAVWLTGTVQIGFVIGALAGAGLNLADRYPPHRVLAVSAAGAALCTVGVAGTDGLAEALPLRLLTGICLAGVYPVGMKLTASWSDSTDRGRALGLLIAALTLGSMLPHLISGLGSLPWRGVLLAAAGLGLFAATVAATVVRQGPHVGAEVVHDPRYAIRMFTEPGPRLANLGYLGHQWELYALWTWLPVFLLASPTTERLPVPVGVAVFATMGVTGAFGCFVGGWAADRFGRPATAATALAVSGTCCLLSPLAYVVGPVLLITLCAVWGASVIADSGVFSTVLSETADPRFVGTALTAQTAIGFALTVVSIQLTPLVADVVGWQYAFLVLVPGPVVGVLAMRALGRSQEVSS